nr:MAG TPA: hypothetical protein [Caudoviricetes sp.]
MIQTQRHFMILKYMIIANSLPMTTLIFAPKKL